MCCRKDMRKRYDKLQTEISASTQQAKAISRLKKPEEARIAKSEARKAAHMDRMHRAVDEEDEEDEGVALDVVGGKPTTRLKVRVTAVSFSNTTQSYYCRHA